MLKYLIDMNEPRDIVLFYANKTADEIAYTDVLTQAQMQSGIRVFYTLTDTEALPRNWRGLTGRINASMICKLVPDYQERTLRGTIFREALALKAPTHNRQLAE